MDTTHKSIETVKAYLLGALNDREASELEAGYFTDPDCLRRVHDIEDHLIEDYFKDRLPRSDRQRFESRYLKVPELRQRLDEIRITLGEKDRQPRFAVWQNLRMALICIGLFAVVGGVWNYSHVRPSGTGSPVTSAIPIPAATVMIRLMPGVAKGSSANGHEFSIPAGGTWVAMVLELPGQRAALDCRVRLLVLDSDGRPGIVWTSQPVRSESVGDVVEVNVLPDPSVLHPADYIAEVVTPDDAILERYVFRILGDH
jgi:hypothetical protein